MQKDNAECRLAYAECRLALAQLSSSDHESNTTEPLIALKNEITNSTKQMTVGIP